MSYANLLLNVLYHIVMEMKIRESFDHQEGDWDGTTDDDLDELSVHCQKILSTQYSEKLDELYRLGGTSGGARPKIMTEIDGKLDY